MVYAELKLQKQALIVFQHAQLQGFIKDFLIAADEIHTGLESKFPLWSFGIYVEILRHFVS
jgi:hypothetical protein